MASVQLSRVELGILQEGNFIWDAGILMTSRKVLDKCKEKKDIQEFIEECENNIKEPSKCKIIYNGEVYNFGGDKFSYIWFFKSEKLQSVVKIALKIDLDNTIVIGYMNFPSEREEKKYHAHQGKILKKQEELITYTTPSPIKKVE